MHLWGQQNIFAEFVSAFRRNKAGGKNGKERFLVTHQFNYSVVHNLIGKVNKHVALSISTILQTALIVKGYPHFTSKFAGLHLVLNTSCLRKKSRLVHNQHMVECFRAITIDAKHLSSTILFEK